MEIKTWLESLALSEYEPAFREHQITADLLAELSDDDLRSMGIAALAAESEEEANALATSRNLWVVKLLTGQPIPFPSPDEAKDYQFSDQELALLRTVRRRSIVGTPEQVRAGLLKLAEAHEAEELVVVTITYDYASRLKSYELLAKAFALTPV